jgi:hypothetical protein
VRTNPKGGTQGNASLKNGSAVPRTTRRRVAQPKSPESTALTAASEDAIPVQDATIEAEIARLAYFLWEARGGVGGSPEEDWLRAEQEILARSPVSSKA